MSTTDVGATAQLENRTGRRDRVRQMVAVPLPGLLLLLVAALLLSMVAAGDSVLAWDIAVTRSAQSAPDTGAGDAARLINALGSTPVMLALGSAAVAALFARRRPGQALFLLAALAARAANPILKAIFDSPRPIPDLVRVTEDASGLGFPSAHVMGETLFFGALLWLAPELVSRRGPRLVLQGVTAALLVAGGFGRIYVGAHWPSDVIGAYLWGGLLLAVLILGYQSLRRVEPIRGGRVMNRAGRIVHLRRSN